MALTHSSLVQIQLALPLNVKVGTMFLFFYFQVNPFRPSYYNAGGNNMKKMILFILMICLGVVVVRFEASAVGTNTFPIGKNYLNLSNLIMKSDNSGYAYTQNPILVKPNQQYTIVLDYGFLGQHSDWLGDIYISIEEYPSHDSYDLLLLGNHVTEKAYVEFIPTEDYIHITSLPMLPTNYDAILYEGLYTDFTGFEPYIAQNETLNYYGVLPIDYDQPMTVEQIKSYIHASDPYGNPLGIFVENDGYSTGTKIPGCYQMTFLTTYNQISKRYYLEVRVFDQVAPIISNPGIISVPLSEKASLNDIKQMISVSDNADTMTSSDLVVIQDTYSSANTIGTYSITVKATDSSLNESSLVITILLVDLKGPIITGPSDIYLYTTDIPLSTEQIKEYYTFIDDVSGTNVGVVFIEDQYEQTQTEGIYNITIKAVDQQLNFSLKNIHIHVIENRGPVFSSDDIILDIDTADNMTEQELIDWFTEHALSMGYDVSHVSILYNEYKNHENEDGSYYVYLNYDVNNETAMSRIRVDVSKVQKEVNYMLYLLIGVPSIGGLVTLFVIKRKNI